MNDVIIADTRQDRLIEVLERTLLDSSISIERVEKILEMQMRVRAEEARSHFFESLALCQSQMPIIVRDKTRTGGPIKGNYASLDQMISQIVPIYTSLGFSVTYDCPPVESATTIFVTAKVSLGAYSEIYTYECPIDAAGGKSNVHGKASAVTYSKRYLLAMIFCLATGDDDDGYAASYAPKPQIHQQKRTYELPPEYIDAEQKTHLLELIERAQSSLDIIYRAYNIACLDDMTVTMYERAVTKLGAKINELEKPQGEDECPNV